jgi:large subunit ribosomal protein L1
MTDSALLKKRRGKKYAEKSALIEKDAYGISDACALLPSVSLSSFDATAEVHVHINADTEQADQLVRTTVSLPHGTGKELNVAAFVPDEMVDEAKKAGASTAGNEDLITSIQEGKFDFDIAVAHPSLMKDIGKVAKVLGPKGLMPNPKSGTVTEHISAAIASLKKGRIEVKMDKHGNIHAPFGKMSFGGDKLSENLQKLLDAISEARPSGIKGIYIQSVTICPSMGPPIPVTI